MAKGTATPRSQQRLRVFESYRGRGKRTNPLWLVYSVKTGRDWILSSDRHLVHWLVFLECEPRVKSFDLGEPPQVNISDFKISVTLADGAEERHVVRSGTPSDSAQQVAELHADGTLCRAFSDIDLKPVVPYAMRWFKALAFAAALRDLALDPVRLALATHLHSERSGTIRHVVEAMNGFEETVVIGMLVRLAIEGHVTLDLTGAGLCYATEWHLREGGNANVVS